MTSNRTTHGIAPRALAVFVGGVLALAGVPAQALPRGDWTRVERLPQGIPTRVTLHASDPADGRNKARGLLESVDSASITLMLRDGRTRTIERDRIRKVAVRRQFAKRYAGWIVAGLTIATTWLLAAKNADPLYPPLYIPGAGLSGFAFWRQRWRDVYRAPALPRH